MKMMKFWYARRQWRREEKWRQWNSNVQDKQKMKPHMLHLLSHSLKKVLKKQKDEVDGEKKLHRFT
jgi:hypothetical protein